MVARGVRIQVQEVNVVDWEGAYQTYAVPNV